MKRFRICLLVFLLLLCSGCAAAGLPADGNAGADRTKTIPDAQDGLVFSITTFDGRSESAPFVPCLGHTWLSLDNRAGHPVTLNDYEIGDGETLTFSIWAISGHRGVFYNLEPQFIRQYQRYAGRRSLHMSIDEAQIPVIERYIREHDRWTLTQNCSRWSVALWNALAGEAYALKTPALLCTPARLQRAFDGFDCVELDRDFSGAGEIFFYQDGVRKELQLCA